MSKILHLSFDFPDKFNNDKTVAIKNLINASEISGNINHYISMNRCKKNRLNEVFIKDKENLEIRKFGFPYGILLIHMLGKFYKDIINNKSNLKSYDIIHAHKLTYEGYIANKLSNKYNIPYCITIRATDFKILKYRRDLKNKYKSILMESKVVFCVSYWMISDLKSVFGEVFFSKIRNKIVVLPNIISVDKLNFNEKNNNKYVTVFKMTKKYIKVKNIEKTIKAFKNLNDGSVLDIIGDGEAFVKVENIIKKHNVEDRVFLKGRINNSKVLEELRNYKGFILCSYPETFGIAYIEALMSGIPIIYSKGTGIDGYFNNVGVSVNSNSVESIEEAIREINTKYEFYKNNVKALQKNGGLILFDLSNISKIYKVEIKNAIGGKL